MKYLFLLMFLVSCGMDKPLTKLPDYDIDPELHQYVELFREDAAKYDVPLKDQLKILKRVNYLSSSKTDKKVIGTCNPWTKKWLNPSFKTSKRKWQEIYVLNIKFSECKLKALMYHELGHCFLGLGHTSDQTLMKDTLWLSERECNEQWGELVEILFLDGK